MVNKKIIALVALASEGVEFTEAYGAICPACNAQRIKTYTTRALEGGIRVRYHRCTNGVCMLASLKTSIKSTEVAEQEPEPLASPPKNTGLDTIKSAVAFVKKQFKRGGTCVGN